MVNFVTGKETCGKKSLVDVKGFTLGASNCEVFFASRSMGSVFKVKNLLQFAPVDPSEWDFSSRKTNIDSLSFLAVEAVGVTLHNMNNK